MCNYLVLYCHILHICITNIKYWFQSIFILLFYFIFEINRNNMANEEEII